MMDVEPVLNTNARQRVLDEKGKNSGRLKKKRWGKMEMRKLFLI